MRELQSDGVAGVHNVLQSLKAKIREFHVIPMCFMSKRSCPTRHFLNDRQMTRNRPDAEMRRRPVRHKSRSP